MSGRPLQIRFVSSASKVDQLPEADVEVAFVGRSNVGKSSLLNAIADRKLLAPVSKTPGRTKTLGCFALDRGGAHRHEEPVVGPAIGHRHTDTDVGEGARDDAVTLERDTEVRRQIGDRKPHEVPLRIRDGPPLGAE